MQFLGGLRFRSDELGYLASLDYFEPDFIDFLAELRFTGDVWSSPEGSVVFPMEPVLRVQGPIAECRLEELADRLLTEGSPSTQK